MDNIYYICDRKACEKCESVCTHTSDASHAKNFYQLDGDLWEYDTAAPVTIQTVPELNSKIIEHLAKSDEIVKLMIPRETIYSLIYEEKTQMLHIIVPQIESVDIGFGDKYTQRFKELVEVRKAIKHRDLAKVSTYRGYTLKEEFPGYKFEFEITTEDVNGHTIKNNNEGGRVWAMPGIYHNVGVFDV